MRGNSCPQRRRHHPSSCGSPSTFRSIPTGSGRGVVVDASEARFAHEDEFAIDEAPPAGLIGDQFPQWSHLAVERVDSSGTVNVIYRLDALPCYADTNPVSTSMARQAVDDVRADRP